MKKLDIAILRQWFKDPKNRVFIGAFATMLIIILLAQLLSRSDLPPAEALPESADTYIPAGYVLVPIELQNADALSSLVGSFALVDLFTGSPGQRNQRVGKKLKLLRAPLNPQQFAVLVPEQDVSQLLSSAGSYWAVLQNPNEKAATSITKKSPHRIEYFEGE